MYGTQSRRHSQTLRIHHKFLKSKPSYGKLNRASKMWLITTWRWKHTSNNSTWVLKKNGNARGIALFYKKKIRKRESIRVLGWTASQPWWREGSNSWTVGHYYPRGMSSQKFSTREKSTKNHVGGDWWSDWSGVEVSALLSKATRY